MIPSNYITGYRTLMSSLQKGLAIGMSRQDFQEAAGVIQNLVGQETLPKFLAFPRQGIEHMLKDILRASPASVVSSEIERLVDLLRDCGLPLPDPKNEHYDSDIEDFFLRFSVAHFSARAVHSGSIGLGTDPSRSAIAGSGAVFDNSATQRTPPHKSSSPADFRIEDQVDENDILMLQPLERGGSPRRSNYRLLRTQDSKHYPLKPIATGGTAEIYLVEEMDDHGKGTGRILALKMIVQGPDFHELLADHKKESDFLRGLKGKNFLHLYTSGISQTGFPFIVTEYANAGSFRKVMDSRDWSPLQKINFAKQIIAAVADLQRLGIVHLDLKPDNFLVLSEDDPNEEGGQRYTLYLADFGLSKKLKDIVPEKKITGTPGFLPPEKLYESKDPVLDSYSNDVWALGVILYELLTGKFPWHGKSVQKINMDSVMRDLSDPENPQIEGPELSRIVLKALAKERDERYPDAMALQEDLDTYIARPLEAKAEAAWQKYLLCERDIDKGAYATEWEKNIVAALEEYYRVYLSDHKYPAVLEKIKNLSYDLYLYGSDDGREDLMRLAEQKINAVAPGSEQAKLIQQMNTVQVQILTNDGKASFPQGTKLWLVHYENRGGILRQESMLELDPDNPLLEYQRYGSHSLVYHAPKHVPVVVTLPVRRGENPIPVPISFYLENEIPPEGVVGVAGALAVLKSPGSLGQVHDNWRPDEKSNRDQDPMYYDWVALPPVTCEKWLRHMKENGGLLQRGLKPRNWVKDVTSPFGYRYENGQSIDPKAPVTHLSLKQMEGYLGALSHEYKEKGYMPEEWVLSPLNGLRLFTRGQNNRRVLPWGDLLAQIGGVAAVKTIDQPVSPAPLPIDRPDNLDVSPLSVLEGLIPGVAPRILPDVVGNVAKILNVSGADKERIAQAFPNIPRDKLHEYVFVYGTAFNRSASIVGPDDLTPVRIDELDQLEIAFIPFGRLRRANRDLVAASAEAQRSKPSFRR